MREGFPGRGARGGPGTGVFPCPLPAAPSFPTGDRAWKNRKGRVPGRALPKIPVGRANQEGEAAPRPYIHGTWNMKHGT